MTEEENEINLNLEELLKNPNTHLILILIAGFLLGVALGYYMNYYAFADRIAELEAHLAKCVFVI